MKAHLAYGWLYERIMLHRDEVDRARVDALLDMPGAKERHTALVADVLADVGFDVR